MENNVRSYQNDYPFLKERMSINFTLYQNSVCFVIKIVPLRYLCVNERSGNITEPRQVTIKYLPIINKIIMARINDVFVSGTLGNVVFYRRMGKPCARIKRAHIRQTDATKKRGINFGIAARTGKGLRFGLTTVMPHPADRSMQSRFSGTIAKWLGQSAVDSLEPCNNIPFVSRFQFAEGASFAERFKVPVVITQPTTNLLHVNIGSFIPTKNISAPAGTVSISLIITVSTAELPTGINSGQQSVSIDIPYNSTLIPAKVMDFPIPENGGTIIITAARLLYYGEKNNMTLLLYNEAFNPAGVIDARYY